MNAKKIRDAARRRGIKHLYHFTLLANLKNILLYGLASSDFLDKNQIDYIYTDEHRYDGHLDAVSVSIHDLNRAMFSKKIKSSHCAWAILEIDASVLWTHRCRFCWGNAASSEMIHHRGYIEGPWALEEMFADRHVSRTNQSSFRDAYNLADNTPTMNDAEVQVFGLIDPELIQEVAVSNKRNLQAAETAMKSAGRVLPIEVIPELFK